MAKIHLEKIIQEKDNMVIENNNFINNYKRSFITDKMIKDLVSNTGT